MENCATKTFQRLIMKPLICVLLCLLLGFAFTSLTAHAHTQDASQRISTLNLSQTNIPTASPCTDFYEYVCASVKDALRKTGFPSVIEEARDYNEKLLLSALSTDRARHTSASRAVSFLVDLYRKWQREASLNRDSSLDYLYSKFYLHSPSFRYVLSRVYVDAAKAASPPLYVYALERRNRRLAENVRETIGRLLGPNDTVSMVMLLLRPLNVGHESWYMNDTALDAWYGLAGEDAEGGRGTLAFNTSKSYLANYYALMGHTLEKRANSPLVSDWKDSVSQTVSWSQGGAIFLPLGYLFPAIFKHNISLASAYATIGSVAGHQLLHNLDLSRKAHLRDVSRCLRAQYSAVRQPQTGRHLPGAKTIREDIVDNGAIKGAFNAYQAAAKGDATLATDGQFFRSYARKFCNIHSPEVLRRKIDMDVHTLQKYRVNLVLSNFPSFSQTFSCPLGTPMNPVKKCIVL